MTTEIVGLACRSTEDHAASFNEGYEEAFRQSVGTASRRAWVMAKVLPAVKFVQAHPHGYASHSARAIADAVLSEVDLVEPVAYPMAVTDIKRGDFVVIGDDLMEVTSTPTSDRLRNGVTVVHIPCDSAGIVRESHERIPVVRL